MIPVESGRRGGGAKGTDERYISKVQVMVKEEICKF